MATEYLLKINGAISIPESLDTKKSVMAGVEVEIFEAAKRDKQDGDYVIIYKGKAVGMPIISQGEKKYKAEVKSKMSRLWRWKVNEYSEDYEEFMRLMLDNADEVIDFVRKLRNL